jgi:hypothetical protein
MIPKAETVFGKDRAQTKNLGPDSIQLQRIRVRMFGPQPIDARPDVALDL